jgi:hypothetical protein
MKTPKEPTPLQLFKQWKKYNLASDKARDEQRLLRDMAFKAPGVCCNRITVDGFIYELTARKGNYSWNATLDVTKLGSVEEFAKLVK